MPEPTVTEVAPDIHRVSVFVPEINLQLNHFVVDDEEPLLFHTGLKDMFPLVLAGVAKVMDPSRLRWIGFSHTESDECGALAEWLQAAPNATPVCSQIGALVNRDFVSTIREARGMADGDTLETGKYRFRFLRTAQLPHGWDAGLLYEETQRMLLCSDLFHQNGDCEPLTESDVVERARNRSASTRPVSWRTTYRTRPAPTARWNAWPSCNGGRLRSCTVRLSSVTGSALCVS